MTVVHS